MIRSKSADRPYPKCLDKDCPNSGTLRGVCLKHYKAIKRDIQVGKYTDAEAVEAGALLACRPPGTLVRNAYSEEVTARIAAIRAKKEAAAAQT